MIKKTTSVKGWEDKHIHEFVSLEVIHNARLIKKINPTTGDKKIRSRAEFHCFKYESSYIGNFRILKRFSFRVKLFVPILKRHYKDHNQKDVKGVLINQGKVSARA